LLGLLSRPKILYFVYHTFNIVKTQQMTSEFSRSLVQAMVLA